MADAMVVESSGPVMGVMAGEEEEAEVDSEDMVSISEECCLREMEFKLKCVYHSRFNRMWEGKGAPVPYKKSLPRGFMWSHLLLLIFIQLIKFHLQSELNYATSIITTMENKIN